MDRRMIEFIEGLRSAGVRISVAESVDALRALEAAGIDNRQTVRAAMQATLIKDPQSIEVFQRLFPFYFGSDQPPMQQPGGDGNLTPEEQQQLEQALQQMLQNLQPHELGQLMQSMMSGQRMSNEELREMLNQLAPPHMTHPYYQSWMARRAMRQLQFQRLEQLLQILLEQLRDAGMDENSLQAIEQAARSNQQALAEQIEQQVGQQMLEMAQGQQPRPPSIDDVMDRPFERLSEQEAQEMRSTVMRLAAQLRSRAALRQRRAKSGQLDAKSTIRANLRFGGVPINVRHRRRHLKPKITVICDLSYSMRPVASFTLLLIYALQDQVSRTRSFAFIDDLEDISMDFAQSRPDQAIDTIQERIRPPGSYATDLGNSLQTLTCDYFDCVDQRTTVLFLGDGRNNHRDPNLVAFRAIKQRARSVIWFNPEPPHMWGMYDPGSLNSDMLEYANYCDAVHHVSNLRQLIAAIDTLFARR
ncbi:MAG: VWA domain-containing protein [Chloroflexaceae bacterium]|nr:VWA domain-containing protein [Chloroflexaceae bacterium]